MRICGKHVRAAMVMAVLVSIGLAGCSPAPLSNPSSNPGSGPGANPATAAGIEAAPRRDLLPTGAGASNRKPPLARMSFGGIVVAGPQGYCLDPATSRSAAAGRGVAVMASCMILSGGKVGENVPPVIVTVTVGPRGAVADLPDAATLAQAAGAQLLTGGIRDGLVVAHLANGGDAMLDGGDTRYWRGAFVQGGRMIGLALYAPHGDVLAGDRGVMMLEKVRASIGRASGVRTASTQPATPQKPAHPIKPRTVSRLFGG